MSEGFIETKGGKIWYSVYGQEKKGIPLLVVHGGPGFVTMPEVVKDFAAERPVYFYDQLGSGNSDQAMDNNYYSVENFVEELAEVRSALKLDQVYLMGFSWGPGLICSYMLDKKPQGVEGLILCAPLLSTPMWDKDQRDHIATMPMDVQKAIVDGERDGDYGSEYQAAMMEYYKKFVCNIDPWPDYLQEAFEKLNMNVYATMWGPSEFTITGKLKDFDLYAKLSNIDEPVLLICGDRDEAGVKTVKDYQMAFPNAHMAVIPNSSHLHQIEQPEIFKAIVNNYLGGK